MLIIKTAESFAEARCQFLPTSRMTFLGSSHQSLSNSAKTWSSRSMEGHSLLAVHGCPPFCWKAHECWLVGCPVEVCKKFGDCLYKIIVTVCVRAGQVYLNAF